MQGSRLELIFDTSALNALADEPESTAILRSIGIGFVTRLTETSLSEIAATPDLDRREQLIAVARHLVHAGEGIRPYNWIVAELTKRHAANPARFNWQTLMVRGPELEMEIARGEMLGGDELADAILKDFEARSAE